MGVSVGILDGVGRVSEGFDVDVGDDHGMAPSDDHAGRRYELVSAFKMLVVFICVGVVSSTAAHFRDVFF